MKRYIAAGIMALVGFGASMGIASATAVAQEQQMAVVTETLTETVTEKPAENTAEPEGAGVTGIHTSKALRITLVVILMLLFLTSPLWMAAVVHWDVTRDMRAK